jgi:hypothetical protein
MFREVVGGDGVRVSQRYSASLSIGDVPRLCGWIRDVNVYVYV